MGWYSLNTLKILLVHKSTFFLSIVPQPQTGPKTKSKFYIHWQYIYYHRWIHDTCVKVEFQIQILHNYHSSNTDSADSVILIVIV